MKSKKQTQAAAAADARRSDLEVLNYLCNCWAYGQSLDKWEELDEYKRSGKPADYRGSKKTIGKLDGDSKSGKGKGRE